MKIGEIMQEILIFLFFGALIGILAGMLGIGGGVISVPLLYFALQHDRFPPEAIIHSAIATSLGSTFITSCGSTWSHYRKRGILFHMLKWIAPGLIIGSSAGAFFSSILPSDLLRVVFGVVTLLLSLYFFLSWLPPLRLSSKPNGTLVFWTLGIGCMSTLLGIGGGIFMVPILLGYQMPLKNAVAVSSLSTLLSALLGSIAFICLSPGPSPLPHTFGSIYIPGLCALGFSSLFTTPFGAHLSHVLPTVLIKRIFACALALTGAALVFGT